MKQQLRSFFHIRILDRFVIMSFVQPFIATFFVSMVVLLMQFLWKHIDDLAGKGLEWYVIAEFLFYSSANLIPLALPLAILLAAIMTFGNLGEKYELVSIKSAGIPLRRVLLPLSFIISLVGFGAFWFSTKVIPEANLKWGALYYDLLNLKPAFDLKEGTFYNGIDGYSIKAGKKNKDGHTISDVIIYDHTKGTGNTTVIVAESGNIHQSEDERFLFFTLYKGKRYEEMTEQPDYYTHLQSNVMIFDKQEIVFDLSQFDLSRTAADLFKDFWRFKDLPELEDAMDSLKGQIRNRVEETRHNLRSAYHLSDTVPVVADSVGVTDIYAYINGPQRQHITTMALTNARTAKGILTFTADHVLNIEQMYAKHEVVWHQKFTLSIACVVLFFIGAPLGAIIRKGGFGLPVIFSVIFFLLFYIINLNGEKMVKELVLPAYIGMWLSIMVLGPIGLWLTIKATRDSTLFDMEVYRNFFRTLFKKKEKKNSGA